MTNRALRNLLGVSCAVLAASGLAGCHDPGKGASTGAYDDSTIRAIWVTRWDYKSSRDIRRIMENCREAGFNTVLFQASRKR